MYIQFQVREVQEEETARTGINIIIVPRCACASEVEIACVISFWKKYFSKVLIPSRSISNLYNYIL